MTQIPEITEECQEVINFINKSGVLATFSKNRYVNINAHGVNYETLSTLNKMFTDSILEKLKYVPCYTLRIIHNNITFTFFS